MNRLEASTAWFFSLLGVILLGVSVLVVPERVFASYDPGSCSEACCSALYGEGECDTESAEYKECADNCENCVTACGDIPGCPETCYLQGLQCQTQPFQH